MLTKPQYSVQDWLDLHELTSQEVLGYCGVIRRKFQSDRSDKSRASSKNLSFNLEQSLEHLILPALKKLLGFAALSDDELSMVRIGKHKTGELDLPFTEWDEDANALAIHLVWSGTADDLVCLAHEMAHAAQMILSKGAFMPPVAREVCAFLGELALIRYAKTQSAAVYCELQAV